MMFKPVFLATDCVLFCLIAALIFYIFHVRRSDELKMRWSHVFHSPAALCTCTILTVFLVVAMIDSVHFRSAIDTNGGQVVYDVKTNSLLDKSLGKAASAEEKTYSEPFATKTFEKISRIENGKPVRDYEPLAAGGAHLAQGQSKAFDIGKRVFFGFSAGIALSLLLCLLVAKVAAIRKSVTLGQELSQFFKRRDAIPYEYVLLPLSVFIILICLVAFLWPVYHVLGTDQTGNDILYQVLKSLRTALVIGSLATLTTLPFAIIFGICAGYFKGWVDDLIQYIYTTLSSIPSVLLIAAAVLMIQVFIDGHPDLYETGLERADLRLFMLSLIIGITGWATLARLLRAETLRISQLDYIQAAKTFGVSHWTIMRRHVLPNLIHIVLIVAVLDFSGIVLYEAVLSYVGVGVDPTTHSFGSMINAGRLELSRSPVVWWNLAASFTFMLTLVLSANFFASVVRDAFDPRLALKRKRDK